MTRIQFISGAVIFIILLFISAPYGKHTRSGWGIMVNSRFSWLLMELPSVLTIAVMLLLSGTISPVNIILLVLWEIHYIYRTFIYTALQRGSKRTFPLMLVFFACLFNINNGIINGHEVFLKNLTLGALLHPLSILGFILFISGFSLHVYSDAIIRSLRKDNEKGYKIPMKGAFRLITNPNYLGEIIEWTGWALLTGSLAGWAFAFFTFCNLFPRAIAKSPLVQEEFF